MSRWTAAELARLRDLHRRGLTDRRMAELLGRRLRAVRRRRHALGLPRVPASFRRLRHLHPRSLRHRVECAQRGWPGCPTRRGADVLDALERRGPLTAQDIAAALGLRWGCPSNLAADPHDLRPLLRRLAALGLVCRGPKRGRHGAPLWSLSARRRTAQDGPPRPPLIVSTARTVR
jgi:hypothetical protein